MTEWVCVMLPRPSYPNQTLEGGHVSHDERSRAHIKSQTSALSGQGKSGDSCWPVSVRSNTAVWPQGVAMRALIKQRHIASLLAIHTIYHVFISFFSDLIIYSYIQLTCYTEEHHTRGQINDIIVNYIHSNIHLSDVVSAAFMLKHIDDFLCLNQLGIFINYNQLMMNSWHLVVKMVGLQFPVSSIAVLQPLFINRAHTSPTRPPSPPLWTTCLLCLHLMGSVSLFDTTVKETLDINMFH